MESKTTTKTKLVDLYYCPRCDINSQSKEWCPCPRGSCEAEIIGEVKTTTITEITVTHVPRRSQQD